MSLTLYELLNVKPSATQAEIKSAYRRAAKLFHSDSGDSDGGNDALFREAREAYEILKDPAKRSLYDAYLMGGSTQQSPTNQKSNPEPRAYTGPSPPKSTPKNGFVDDIVRPKKKRPKSPSLLLVALIIDVMNALVDHVVRLSVINDVFILFIWIALIGAFTIPKSATRRFYSLIFRLASHIWFKQSPKVHTNK